MSREPSIAEVFRGYVEDQRDRLVGHDRRLRAGERNASHEVRVASRRLRSVFATYRPVLDGTAAHDLAGELRWLGGVLSPVRDAEVLLARLTELAETRPDDPDLIATGEAIRSALGRRIRLGNDEVTDALASDRHVRLLADLEVFVGSPVFRPEAAGSARAGLPELLQADLARVLSRDKAWRHTSDPLLKDHNLHQVRKAAKRLRYSAESARPALGKRAGRLAGRAKTLQEVLGEYQDTVVSRQFLNDLARDGADPVVVGLGELHALELAQARRTVERYPAALGRLPQGRLGSWFSR